MKNSHFREIIEEDKIGIPGIKLLGYHHSIKAARPLPLHIHDGCVEIVVFIKGSEYYHADDQDFHLTGGQAFISFLNEPHSSAGTSQGINEFIWFQINMDIQKDFLGLSEEMGNQIRKILLNYDHHIIKVDLKCIQMIKEVFYSVKNNNAVYAAGLFSSFLYRLFMMQKDNLKNNTAVERAVQYINENICDHISIEAISKHCSVSTSLLKHNFKEYTGKTPREYINELKIAKAKELLKEGMNITETAMKLSFSSSDYFSTVFKKYTFLTPTDYKKMQ